MQKASLCRNVLFCGRVLKYIKKLSSTQIRIVISHSELSSFASSVKEGKFSRSEFQPGANINKSCECEVKFYYGKQASIENTRGRYFIEHAKKKMKNYLLSLNQQSEDPQSIYCKPLRDSLTQDESSLFPYRQRILNYVNNVEASDLTVDQHIKLLWLLYQVAPNADNHKQGVSLVNSLCQQLESLSYHEFWLLCFFMLCWKTMTTTICTRVQNYVIDHETQFDVIDLAIVAHSIAENGRKIDNDHVTDLFGSAALQIIDSVDFKIIYFDPLLKSIKYSPHLVSNKKWLEPITRALNKLPKEKFTSMPWISISRYLQWVMEWPYVNDDFNERLKNCLYDGSIEFKRPEDIKTVTNYLAKTDYEVSGKYPMSSLITKYLEILRDFKDESTSTIVAIAKACAQIGIFDEKLNDQLLAQDYVVKCHDRPEMANCVMFLDCSIAIECPSYAGNRLTPESYNWLLKQIHVEALFHVKSRQTYLKMICSAMNLDSSCAYIGNILPHFPRTNLLLRFKDGQVLPAHAGFPTDIPVRAENYKAPDDETWVCAIISSAPLRGKYNKINGFEGCQRRQLLKLGYKIVEINCRNSTHLGVRKTPQKDIVDLFNAIQSDGTNFTKFTLWY